MQMNRLGLLDRILTFEADAFNFRQLDANLLVNDPASRIERNFAAVSDEDGEVSFFSSLAQPDGNRGGVGIGNAQVVQTAVGDTADVERVHANVAAGAPRTVRAVRLDTVCDFKDHFLFFKIDVEGHEFEVLNGMPELLASNRCYLQIECLRGVSDLKPAMEARGYQFLGTIAVDHYFSNYDPAAL